MSRRLLLLITALGALLAVPTLAGASIVYEASTGAGSNHAMYMADDDGANATKLPVTGQFPVVSPNGAIVAYEKVTNSKTGAMQLHFLTLATGAVLNTGVACGGPVWAPNSSIVACTTTQATGDIKGIGLSTITTTGTASVIVPSVGFGVNGYSFSPDSSTVVWSQVPFGVYDVNATLRALPVNGGGAVTKLGKGSQPIWGPSKIAFIRTTRVVVDGAPMVRSQIWTVDPAIGASSAVALTAYKAKGFVEGPLPLRWTPDGTKIVGQLTGEDYTQPIYVTANGKIHQFGPTNAGVYGVSADGTQALVVGNLLGGGKQPVYASPLGKMASSLLLKDAWEPSVTANWQP
jgi:Tol biopolymer transport system component